MSWLDLRLGSLINFPLRGKFDVVDRFFFGMEPYLQETMRHLFDQYIDFFDLLMATQQNEAKDLDAKVHSHVKDKSAVEAPKERWDLWENWKLR